VKRRSISSSGIAVLRYDAETYDFAEQKISASLGAEKYKASEGLPLLTEIHSDPSAPRPR
jgi:hypothetical protein